MSEDNEPGFDLKSALGAKEEPTTQKISIYLPNKDRHGNVVPDIEDWIAAGMRILTEINLGVTRLPWAEGTWKSGSGEVVVEETTLIYSYIRQPHLFRERFPELQVFLDSFGRDTGQGEVMVEFFGEQPPAKDVGELGGMYFRIYTIPFE